MTNFNGVSYLGKGVEALHNNHFYLARACFEQAVSEGNDLASCSYLAWCRAKTSGEYAESIALAEQALSMEPANPLHYLNLGKIYLLAGNNLRGMELLRQGIPYDNSGEIVQELAQLDTRKTPLFPSLPRPHPLNRYLGLFLSHLGIR